MTVKLELNPKIEAGLIAQAQALGLSLETYLNRVLENAADVFVVKQGNNWVVKEPHREHVSEIVPTQAQAIERAKDLVGREENHSRKRPANRKNLAQLFAESPFKGLNLKFERDPDTGRSVKL